MAETEKKDTSAYSASKAPEVRKEAVEPRGFSDERLRPGGPHGSPADLGMSGIDRDKTPHGGQSTGQERYGEKAE